jgi:hypothetical protein
VCSVTVGQTSGTVRSEPLMTAKTASAKGPPRASTLRPPVTCSSAAIVSGAIATAVPMTIGTRSTIR